MGVSIKEFLDLPVMREARVLAAQEALEERVATWVAVIERPVEDFVSEGEVVLTTGQGCDADDLEQLIGEVLDARPAAICLSLHPDGGLKTVPEAVVTLAGQAGCPLIELPWRLRFADVMRGLIDLVVATQYSAGGQAPDELHMSFTTALLEGDGLDAVAEALEAMIERPILVLDTDLQPVGSGPRAREALGEDGLDARWRAAHALSAEERLALRSRLVAYRPRRLPGIDELDLGAGTIVCATARRQFLGYVYALETGPDHGLPSLDRRALQLASVSISLELLRRRAVAETEARIRGDFFWDLALGALTSRQEIATKAVLLGLSLRSEHQVAVARLLGGDGEAPAEADGAGTALDAADRSLRRQGGPGLVVARRAGELLVLLAAGSGSLGALVAEALEGDGGGSLNWGIAEGSYELAELEHGYRAALRALSVGHGLRGRGAVADGAELEPFLMLGGLSDDAEAIRAARTILEPVLDYDRRTSRDLIGTLETFLFENGNTSSAARRLHLSRHALLYRIRKIEEMTGRSLDAHEDRFLLELSLKLLRFAAADDDRGSFASER